MAQSFEAILGAIVKEATREAVREELKSSLPTLLPASAVAPTEWIPEDEFRERFGFKSLDGLMSAVRAGTVERVALTSRHHACRLRVPE